MKAAFCLLLLVAIVHAGPIPSDSQRRTQSVQADKQVAIVGSSQVDAKSGGKVTIHLDQRSQIGGQESDPVVPVERDQTVVAKVAEKVKQPAVPLLAVDSSVELAKQEPVLIGRNQVPQQPKPVDNKQSEVQPVKNEILSARNEVSQSSQVQSAVVVPVVKEEVVQKVEKPVVLLEQVPVLQPAIQVVPVIPEVPVVVQSVVVSEPVVPQAIVIPEVRPVEPVKEPIRVKEPSLEVRSSSVQGSQSIVGQTSGPVQPESVLSSQHSPQPSENKKVQLDSRNIETKEEKVEIKQKQVESQARNLNVDQTPVKVPVVVQKQVVAGQAVKPVKEQQPLQVSQGVKLEEKPVVLPVVKTEPVILLPVQPVSVQSAQVPLVQAEVKSEVRPLEEKPVIVEPLPALPKQSLVPQVVLPVVKTVEPVVQLQQLSSVQAALVPKPGVVIGQDSVKPVSPVQADAVPLPVVKTVPVIKPVPSQPEQSVLRVDQVVAQPVKVPSKSL